ncbi:unnamed protein product [Heterobilharzia americana]|nr:unnamed protein product [Heterobilharzia americana]
MITVHCAIDVQLCWCHTRRRFLAFRPAYFILCRIVTISNCLSRMHNKFCRCNNPAKVMNSLKLLNTYPRHSYLLSPNVLAVFRRQIYHFGPTFTNKPQSYKERRLLGYSPEDMFDIAVDVGRYSEFVPWCNQSDIVERGESNMLARLGVGFPPLSESYISRITFQRPKHLKSVAQNAHMFHHLINEWHIQPGLPDNPQSCFLEFSVDFEFRSPLYSNIAGLFLIKSLRSW